MPKHQQRKIPQAFSQGVESYPDNPAMVVLPKVVQIRNPEERAKRVIDYMGYVSARYGEGIDDAIQASGSRYQAFTGPVSRQFKRGTHAPNPFTPLTCLLAQSSEIDVAVAIESYFTYQERFQARRAEWGEIGLMKGQNITLIKSPVSEVLQGFPDAHFDEITCRFPHSSSPEFASLLLSRLNTSGSTNPNGASVLIGMKFPQGERLAEVFDGVICKSLEGVEGFELKTSVHNVGGAGSPAKLWQIIKTQK